VISPSNTMHLGAVHQPMWKAGMVPLFFASPAQSRFGTLGFGRLCWRPRRLIAADAPNTTVDGVLRADTNPRARCCERRGKIIALVADIHCPSTTFLGPLCGQMSRREEKKTVTGFLCTWRVFLHRMTRQRHMNRPPPEVDL